MRKVKPLLTSFVLCAVTWEYPPATSEPGVSPRPKGDEVYVPREPLGKHHAESPISTLKSCLSAYQQPIPEAKEGSSASEASASVGSSLGEADAHIRKALPNGVSSHTEQQEDSDHEELDMANSAKVTEPKGDARPSSALSAALSEGSATGSEQGQAKVPVGGLEQGSSAAAAKEEPSASSQDHADEKHADLGQSAPRSIPGSGRRVGRAPQLRAQHSAGLSASPAGVNSSTGTAMFWTGSQALGIAFADSSERPCAESPADKPNAAAMVELAHSPLETKALAHGLAFEGSADDEGSSASQQGNTSSAAINGHVVNGVLERSSSAVDAPAKEALAERANEDVRQRGISNIAAAAVAEVDAEKAQQESATLQEQRSQPAGATLSGELPPGEQLLERGSMEEEREALSVSPVSFTCHASAYRCVVPICVDSVIILPAV